MTDYEQKDNRGVLFTNDRKESDTHPDSKGNAKIDGTEYWVSAWRETSKGGKKYLSLSFTKKDAAPKAAQSTTPDPDYDDDVPF